MDSKSGNTTEAKENKDNTFVSLLRNPSGFGPPTNKSNLEVFGSFRRTNTTTNTTQQCNKPLHPDPFFVEGQTKDVQSSSVGKGIQGKACDQRRAECHVDDTNLASMDASSSDSGNDETGLHSSRNETSDQFTCSDSSHASFNETVIYVPGTETIELNKITEVSSVLDVRQIETVTTTHFPRPATPVQVSRQKTIDHSPKKVMESVSHAQSVELTTTIMNKNSVSHVPKNESIAHIPRLNLSPITSGMVKLQVRDDRTIGHHHDAPKNESMHQLPCEDIVEKLSRNKISELSSREIFIPPSNKEKTATTCIPRAPFPAQTTEASMEHNRTVEHPTMKNETDGHPSLNEAVEVSNNEIFDLLTYKTSIPVHNKKKEKKEIFIPPSNKEKTATTCIPPAPFPAQTTEASTEHNGTIEHRTMKNKTDGYLSLDESVEVSNNEIFDLLTYKTSIPVQNKKKEKDDHGHPPHQDLSSALLLRKAPMVGTSCHYFIQNYRNLRGEDKANALEEVNKELELMAPSEIERFVQYYEFAFPKLWIEATLGSAKLYTSLTYTPKDLTHLAT